MANYEFDPSSLSGAKYILQNGGVQGKEGDPSTLSTGLARATSQAFDGTIDFSNTMGFLESLATGNPTTSPPALVSAPGLSGGTEVGNTVACSTGVWTGAPAPTFTYQFMENGVGDGDTTNALVLPNAVGHTIKCQVTASNGVGTPVIVDSNTITITAYNPNNLPNNAAVMAMLNAGVGVSGGKSYLMAGSTDFGTLGIYGYDFSSNPITITGQVGTVVQWMEFDSSSGITWENFNVYGTNPSFGAGIAIHNTNPDTPSTLTFHNVTTNTGDPNGTQDGNGWQLRNLNRPNITISGQRDATKPDISGRGNAMSIIDCGSSGTIVINNLTITNNGVDGILLSGAKNVTIDGALGYDFFSGVGDHPDFIQGFNSPTNSCENITIRNCGMLQGAGVGQQGYFFEDAINLTVDSCYTYTGVLFNMVANARGTTANFNNCFCQGITDSGNGNIVTRGGAVNTTVTNCYASSISNYTADGVNPGYLPNPLPGTNHTLTSVTYGDYAALDAWLAANPSVRARP